MDVGTLRVAHRVWSPGVFHRLLPEPGHARVQLDIDDGARRRLLAAGPRPPMAASAFKRLDWESQG